jgi:hypothetical protein
MVLSLFSRAPCFPEKGACLSIGKQQTAEVVRISIAWQKTPWSCSKQASVEHFFCKCTSITLVQACVTLPILAVPGGGEFSSPESNDQSDPVSATMKAKIKHLYKGTATIAVLLYTCSAVHQGVHPLLPQWLQVFWYLCEKATK